MLPSLLAEATPPRNPIERKPNVSTAKPMSSTSPPAFMSLKQTRKLVTPRWKPVLATTANAWKALGTTQVELATVAAKIVKQTATVTHNYWSLLTCLVEEQEETPESGITTKIDTTMTFTSVVTSPANKAMVHWVWKLENRRWKKKGIVYTKAMLEAAPAEDKDALEDTGKLTKKMFIFPYKRISKAIKKMLLRHKLCPEAREMNIVPGLHSTLIIISMPKLADTGYTTVFMQDGSNLQWLYTPTLTANHPPILESPQWKLTGLWKLPLKPGDTSATLNNKPLQNEAISIIFDLHSACQTFLWYHPAAEFLVKETFIKAVRHGNYSTWTKLTIQLINKYMPDSDETAKGHWKS
jgi:hypothetical protein